MFDPKLWGLVIFLSLIGVLTKLVYYRLGKGGKKAVMEHFPRITEERWQSIDARYREHGVRSLLLASIPAIGSALAAMAGAAGLKLTVFVLVVFISNMIRNWLLLAIFGQTLTFFTGGK